MAAIASSAQTFTTLANLPKDNQYPMGALVEGLNGNFYGSTQNNAVFLDGGTIFVVTPAGSVTTLRNLSLSDGGIANELVLNPDGTFYGTACCGSTANGGRRSISAPAEGSKYCSASTKRQANPTRRCGRQVETTTEQPSTVDRITMAPCSEWIGQAL